MATLHRHIFRPPFQNVAYNQKIIRQASLGVIQSLYTQRYRFVISSLYSTAVSFTIKEPQFHHPYRQVWPVTKWLPFYKKQIKVNDGHFVPFKALLEDGGRFASQPMQKENHLVPPSWTVILHVLLQAQVFWKDKMASSGQQTKLSSLAGPKYPLFHS